MSDRHHFTFAAMKLSNVFWRALDVSRTFLSVEANYYNRGLFQQSSKPDNRAVCPRVRNGRVRFPFRDFDGYGVRLFFRINLPSE
jgi:hypothetical protein